MSSHFKHYHFLGYFFIIRNSIDGAVVSFYPQLCYGGFISGDICISGNPTAINILSILLYKIRVT